MEAILSNSEVKSDEIQFIDNATVTLEEESKEVNSMDLVLYSKTREVPLILGSNKGNIVHIEACTALCSMIKSVLCLETGLIATNINYKSPNPTFQGLLEGNICVATEQTPLEADCIPVISLSFSGTIAATLLKKNSNYNTCQPTSLVIPRIVFYPATTENGIKLVFEYIKNNPDLPEEFFSLLSKMSLAPACKPFRGYAIFQKGKNPDTEIKPISSANQQVWYIMTGSGCQWPGMGLHLMKIEAFAKSMNKSSEILKSYEVDLFDLLRADRKHFYIHRNLTASLVAICSIQIALVDLLNYLGITPDGIIGHSFGELAAAYADGACTHEQVLLVSYFMGHSIETANLPEGKMAALCISWNQAKEMCPKDVFPACDNSYSCVTISGLKDPFEKFIKQLEKDNISVFMVNSQGFGFHCKFVEDAAPLMKQQFKKIIPNPQPRSERWISTSYPESHWNLPDCQVCGPEYLSHIPGSLVRFTDALKKIPANAIVIEVGPDFQFQSVIKRVVGHKINYQGLMQRDCEDANMFFMEALGRLYLLGINPKIELLYPEVKFPVHGETLGVSDLIKWNHGKSFSILKFSLKTDGYLQELKLDEDDANLLDHRVDEQTFFPGSGFVLMAWETLTEKHRKNFQQMPIVIENLKILESTITNSKVLFRKSLA